MAAELGDFALVKLLVEYGANYALENKNKELPEDIASKAGHEDIREYFKQLMQDQ